MRTVNDYEQTMSLKPGDHCLFRYPARSEWLPGVVVKNGGHYYWTVRDEGAGSNRRGQEANGLYIEHISAALEMEDA